MDEHKNEFKSKWLTTNTLEKLSGFKPRDQKKGRVGKRENQHVEPAGKEMRNVRIRHKIRLPSSQQQKSSHPR